MSCEDCIWYGQCYTYGKCEYFSPVAEDIDGLVEDGRSLFHDEWTEYIKESGE